MLPGTIINYAKRGSRIVSGMFADRLITPEEVAAIYAAQNAFWQHDGNMSNPHALLRSGLHSDGFINSRPALACSWIAHIVAFQLRRIYAGPFPTHVLSASYGGGDIGTHLAHLMGIKHIYTEKVADDQVFTSEIGPDDVLLPIEELVTKGTSGGKMVRAVKTKFPNAVFTPDFYAFILRSNTAEIEGLPIKAVVRFEMSEWAPEACPLCKAGSEAMTAKGDNWAKYFSSARR